MTTISTKEDKLIMAARLLDEDQLDLLVDFVDSLIKKKRDSIPSQKEKQSFIRVMEEIRLKAQERGLTEEILERILREDE